MGGMEVDLLGRFAVRRDGHEVPAADFGGRLPRRLVRVLAASHGQVVTRDALVAALWEADPPADPEANLNVLVNRARRAMGDPGAIETAGGGYVLRGPGITVDTERLEGHLREARQALARRDLPAAEAAVDAGTALWRGEPLPEDAYADWARPTRDAMERAYQGLLELGASVALASGAASRAADLAAMAVERAPLREAAHLLLIRALSAGGDQAAALAAYGQLRRTLAEELGIDPSQEAAALHQRILRGTAEGPAPLLAAAMTPLVGREAELRVLSTVSDEASVALVAGRAGAGKSRLLAELVARTDRPVLSARAVLPEREAPWSLASALVEQAIRRGVEPAAVLPARAAAALAEVVPGMAADPSALEPRTARAFVLRGAVGVLWATGPSLVVVDDLQWADSSSLELLALLAERRDGLAMVLAYRPEEVADDTPVARLLADLSATQPVEVGLGRLGADAIVTLVGSPAVAAALAEDTDGTPFAVLEAMRDLERAGSVRRRDGRWQPVAPDVADRARLAARVGQQRAIWVRTQRQPLVGRELVGLLALLGRPCSATLLAAATGSAVPDVLAGLHRLALAELVRQDPRGFTVAHDLVGETVRDRLEPVHRARLHRLLARALAAEGVPAEELARHLSGAGDVPAAAAAYVAAAQDRLERFADREAEQLAEEGLALQPGPQARRALLVVRAETLARRGDLGAAREELRVALSLTGPGPDRSRLLARLASLVSGSDDLVRASNIAELALVEAADEPAARGHALHVAALLDMNLERTARAHERFDEALALFSQTGDAPGVADIADAKAMAQFMAGDLTGAVESLGRVAGLFADAGNLLRAVTPRATRGHSLVFAGRPEEALVDIHAALEAAQSLGYAEGEAFSLWQRAEALAACGRPAEAQETAEASVAVARRIGHRGWTATALRGRGIAKQAAGDLAGAEAAFRESLATSEHLPLFTCWAHARLALLLVTGGRLDEAAPHVAAALGTGPPLGHYEARLAHCELAVARGEPAAQLVARAAELAARGGHAASLGRLRELARAAG